MGERERVEEGGWVVESGSESAGSLRRVGVYALFESEKAVRER
jgi:hypothetical protein